MVVIPPKYIRENARKALAAIKEGSDAMLPVGRRRASQLASGKPIGKVTLQKMSRFKRHLSNAKYTGDWKKDKGAVAWLGWGNSISNGRGKADASAWAKRQLEDWDNE